MLTSFPDTGQNQAGHRLIILVVEAIVVDVHALREAFLGLALHLDVDDHPGFLAVPPPDLDQLVHVPADQLGLGKQLLEFLVEHLVALRPVDVGMDVREKEGQKFLKVTIEGFLPGLSKSLTDGAPLGSQMSLRVERSANRLFQPCRRLQCWVIDPPCWPPLCSSAGAS
jgi:hypothetical protein